MNIKIGYRTFVVQAYTRKEVRAWTRAYGTLTYNPNIIRLDPDVEPIEQARALLHECMHGIYFASGADREQMSQEDVCGMLDQGLILLFQRNPDLLDAITDAIREGKAIIK